MAAEQYRRKLIDLRYRKYGSVNLQRDVESGIALAQHCRKSGQPSSCMLVFRRASVNLESQESNLPMRSAIECSSEMSGIGSATLTTFEKWNYARLDGRRQLSPVLVRLRNPAGVVAAAKLPGMVFCQ
jgi:hypothetical protein